MRRQSPACIATCGRDTFWRQTRTTEWPLTNLDRDAVSVQGTTVDRLAKIDELIQKLEEAHAIADELSDDVQLSLIERALRHARILSELRPVRR